LFKKQLEMSLPYLKGLFLNSIMNGMKMKIEK
jgi:hypothetical protein